MNENYGGFPSEAPALLGCAGVDELIAPFVEGSLSYSLTERVLAHLHQCRHCDRQVSELRTFLRTQPAPVEELVRAPIAPPPPVTSPFWAEWQDRLNRWLDVVFPGTAALAYRDAERPGPPGWEHAARRQSETPLLTARQGDLHLTLHVARGLAFGWLTSLSGEPMYPMLVTLTSDYGQESVLNHSDGTFQIRWDPEATMLDCQSPTGVINRFPLPEEL